MYIVHKFRPHELCKLYAARRNSNNNTGRRRTKPCIGRTYKQHEEVRLASARQTGRHVTVTSRYDSQACNALRWPLAQIMKIRLLMKFPFYILYTLHLRFFIIIPVYMSRNCVQTRQLCILARTSPIFYMLTVNK